MTFGEHEDVIVAIARVVRIVTHYAEEEHGQISAAEAQLVGWPLPASVVESTSRRAKALPCPATSPMQLVLAPEQS